MASWVFCNRCFQPPQGTACFSLTNCGHVYCDVCLRKGKRDECLICKVPCRSVLLSKRTDSDVQALFMGIDGLCRKYARETSQVLEFQEKHRRRLLAFYGEKISQLEESLRKSALRMGQPQSVRLSQQMAFSTIKSPVSTPSAKPNGPLFLPPGSSASARVESMEVDLTPSPRRKCEVATGLTRISLLSPPRDGRMASPPCGPTVMLPCGCGFQVNVCRLACGAEPGAGNILPSGDGRLADTECSSLCYLTCLPLRLRDPD
ncbi:probable E3 SUMO-protein ligase RNF212 [Phocoena phocoena]|uniref:probable E3 SUMO-protein ligase RNF212 n=1 Tax=Phocoena phocoena TaxID=9742 RepID=UPI003307B354